MKIVSWIFIFLLFIVPLYSQKIQKEFEAVKISSTINIDGKILEDEWEKAPLISSFTAAEPVANVPSIKNTEVKFLYDDDNIYISAKIFDEMNLVFGITTERDKVSQVTDNFAVYLDPYHDGQNGYGFVVSSKNVQEDFRNTNLKTDYNWDAVWISKVQWEKDYWSLEMKIPYSALRFEKKDIQNWGINFKREIRRTREQSYWYPYDVFNANTLEQMGVVKNLKDIKPPLRLIISPYVSFYQSKSLAKNFTVKSGADIKWGINESFTFDMTLVPDFGQVQSDPLIENLSPYEVRFDDFRPFFTEGSEYFNKHNSIFYTRRIGQSSNYFYDKNPNVSIDQTPEIPLLNALKVTGKNNQGVALGLYNAITGNSFATTETNENILFEPASNFNVLVLEKALKNTGVVSFINTNVTRSRNGKNANVTGMYQNLVNKKGYFFESNFYLSDVTEKTESRINDVIGTSYFLNLGKRNGRIRYNVMHEAISPIFDPTDLGFQFRNDNRITKALLNFNDNQPHKAFQIRNFNYSMTYKSLYDVNKFTDFEIATNHFMILKWKFFGYSFSTETHPFGRIDYDEPRTRDGRFFLIPPTTNFKIFITTDYRKKIALDAYVQWIKWYNEENRNKYELFLNFLIRPNNKIFIKPRSVLAYYSNQRAFATFQNSEPVFGQRNLYNVVNSITATYSINPFMNINWIGRHYWLHTTYSKYFDLLEDGNLSERSFQSSTFQPSFSSNFLSMDIVYTWIFLPGSSLSFSYKNNIAFKENSINRSYFDNFSSTLDAEQTNIFSLRLLYYFDVNQLKKVFKK